MADRVGDSAEVRRSLVARQPRSRGGEAVEEPAVHEADRGGQARGLPADGQSEHASVHDPLKPFLPGTALNGRVTVAISECGMPVADPARSQDCRDESHADFAIHHGGGHREHTGLGVWNGAAAGSQAGFRRGAAAKASAEVGDDCLHRGLGHTGSQPKELQGGTRGLCRPARRDTSRQQQRPDQRARGRGGWWAGQAGNATRRQEM